ncbi:MAG: hypothetical protein IJI20_00915 [Firmicutes bacterium]|nr:hypothetical protein [Bacillota bacterium]
MEEATDGEEYILDLQEGGTAVVTSEGESTGTWTETGHGVHVTAGDTNADFDDLDGN